MKRTVNRSDYKRTSLDLSHRTLREIKSEKTSGKKSARTPKCHTIKPDPSTISSSDFNRAIHQLKSDPLAKARLVAESMFRKRGKDKS